MAKKSVDKSLAAYKSKGMKAPRPKGYEKLDPSMAPKVKPSMKHKEPPAKYQYPKGGEQSVAPEHKKQQLPMEDAPEGVKGVNEGSEYKIPKSGGRGESEV